MPKLNSSEKYEHLCNVVLTKEKFPIAYERRVKELVDLGVCNREEAEKIVEDEQIELELYYSVNYGVFAVDASAVEDGADIFDPYTGEKWGETDEEDDV